MYVSDSETHMKVAPLGFQEGKEIGLGHSGCHKIAEHRFQMSKKNLDLRCIWCNNNVAKVTDMGRYTPTEGVLELS